MNLSEKFPNWPPIEPLRMPADDTDFTSLVALLDAGDQTAARVIYERFIDRLVSLAASKLDRRLGAKADPESVAQSVFQSFFERRNVGQIEVSNWGMVFGLLSHITLRKCLNRNRDLRRQRRDASRTVSIEDWQAVASGPGPAEEASVSDLLAQAFESFDSDEQAIIASFLNHPHTETVAMTFGLSVRTVQRIIERFRKRLTALIEAE